MSTPRGEEALAIFQDRRRAETAAERVREAGVDESRIRLGDEADSRDSVQAEMGEEMEQSWVSPQAAFALPKEAAKGASLLIPVSAAVGVLVALPFALIAFGSVSVWVRVVGAVMAGALAGATVGAVVGTGLAAKGPDEPLAAERGVTLRVADTSDAAIAALRQEEPIRLDIVDRQGQRVSTVTTEEERSPDGVAQDLAEDFRRPEGEWSTGQTQEPGRQGER